MRHTLNNPIIPGFYPDPSICRVGEMLGMFATGNGAASENCACFDWAEMK